ncbi:MAG: ligase-associated DNA damage response exonuclease [Phormidesmis sp. RL_2_1]|nr:ligase-associated DNA damage response exonuclease [Phormidesmis sp. RL_2_1]
MITVRPQGLYCTAGDFYIDPWQPVETALITHAHADHAYSGHQHYYATAISEGILRKRLGKDIHLRGVAYGEKLKIGDTWVSFHSAGHVLGSAQVRVEHQHDVWVVSGDYKRDFDPSCEPFEVVRCDHFITEATFGLPIYRWDSGQVTAEQIYQWWEREPTRPSLLFCYAFGKSQRVLAELTQFTDRTVYLHGAVNVLSDIYRDAGIKMLPTLPVSQMEKSYKFAGDLIIAPPSSYRSSWMKRFKQPQTAFASGWMAVRGNRRRRGYERGFVLSDHADWPGLLQTIEQTNAKKIYVTHGQNDVLARYLTAEMGLEASPLETLFEGEREDAIALEH